MEIQFQLWSKLPAKQYVWVNFLLTTVSLLTAEQKMAHEHKQTSYESSV